jgi:bifunctional non-homologous end joining protein LigD
LLLGVHDDEGLRYAGKVGTGFTQRSLAELAKVLVKLEAEKAPFVDPPTGREARGVHWTRPELVVEVAFSEWTSEGIVRHPSFQGIRHDVKPHAVRRERAAAPPIRAGGRRAPRSEGSAGGDGVSSKLARRERPKHGSAGAKSSSALHLTNPGRVLWPEGEITKQELAEYYVAVAQWIMPHVAGRPLTLLRCPRGYREQCFYQRHVPEGAPPSIRGVPIRDRRAKHPYLAIDDLEGLLSLVQLDVLELHAWGARVDRLDFPDRIVIDLDPDPAVPWRRVVETAVALRERLEQLDLAAFVRTTGGKGLHVVVPIGRRSPWDEVKQFSKDLVTDIARREPSLYVLTATKAKRSGKIYLDYLRNGRGASAIASYSTRARAGAPVATPVGWDELDARLDPSRFTVRTIPARLAKLRSDPWHGMLESRQALTKAHRNVLGRTPRRS